MAKYDLVQYGCDNCGELTEVLDPDDKLPKGWVFGETFRLCYCPECAKKINLTESDKS